MAIQHQRARPSAVRVRLGELLREARVTAGLTQRTLAKRLGYPPSCISRIELGQRRVYMSEFFAIARALKIDAARLLADFRP